MLSRFRLPQLSIPRHHAPAVLLAYLHTVLASRCIGPVVLQEHDARLGFSYQQHKRFGCGGAVDVAVQFNTGYGTKDQHTQSDPRSSLGGEEILPMNQDEWGPWVDYLRHSNAHHGIKDETSREHKGSGGTSGTMSSGTIIKEGELVLNRVSYPQVMDDVVSRLVQGEVDKICKFAADKKRIGANLVIHFVRPTGLPPPTPSDPNRPGGSTSISTSSSPSFSSSSSASSSTSSSSSSSSRWIPSLSINLNLGISLPFGKGWGPKESPEFERWILPIELYATPSPHSSTVSSGYGSNSNSISNSNSSTASGSSSSSGRRNSSGGATTSDLIPLPIDTTPSSMVSSSPHLGPSDPQFAPPAALPTGSTSTASISPSPLSSSLGTTSRHPSSSNLPRPAPYISTLPSTSSSVLPPVPPSVQASITDAALTAQLESLLTSVLARAIDSVSHVPPVPLPSSTTTSYSSQETPRAAMPFKVSLGLEDIDAVVDKPSPVTTQIPSSPLLSSSSQSAPPSLSLAPISASPISSHPTTNPSPSVPISIYAGSSPQLSRPNNTSTSSSGSTGSFGSKIPWPFG